MLGDYVDFGIGDIPGMMGEIWVEASDATRAAAKTQLRMRAEMTAPNLFVRTDAAEADFPTHDSNVD
ncbi:MAG TPA: hypothetical protein VKU82_12125 [Planctomycetaceae bacterium]|nr:hypothetical protein [Planctomycetaceae bacterium]